MWASFTAALHLLSPEELRKLIRFTTGSPNIPCIPKMVIEFETRSAVINASTCFKVLKLSLKFAQPRDECVARIFDEIRLYALPAADEFSAL